MLFNVDFKNHGAFKVACQYYVTSKYDYLILKVRFKVCFYPQKYSITKRFTMTNDNHTFKVCAITRVVNLGTTTKLC